MQKIYSESFISEVIELAWEDRASFDMIERQTGLKEKDVIAIMQANMKASSFRMWRKRVSGRKTKHDHALSTFKYGEVIKEKNDGDT